MVVVAIVIVVVVVAVLIFGGSGSSSCSDIYFSSGIQISTIICQYMPFKKTKCMYAGKNSLSRYEIIQ